MHEKQRHQVKINGKEYIILSQKSQEHIELVADMVNQQLEHLAEMAPELSLIDQAILLAVNAISDQIDKEERMMDLEAELKAIKGIEQKNNVPQSSPVEKYRLADHQPRGINRIKPNESKPEGQA